MRNAMSLAIVAGCACSAIVLVGAQGRGQQSSGLPEGPGRELVQNTCSKCHGVNMIAGSWGNTDAGWRELFSSMVTLPKAEADSVAAYLARNFPPKPAPEAVIVPGFANVTFKEWVVPTLGSRPHDPLAAADGSLWWTGQFADRLGRLDPSSGEMKEFPVARPRSGWTRTRSGLTRSNTARPLSCMTKK